MDGNEQLDMLEWRLQRVAESYLSRKITQVIRYFLKLQLIIFICGFWICEFTYLQKCIYNPNINTHGTSVVIRRHVHVQRCENFSWVSRYARFQLKLSRRLSLQMCTLPAEVEQAMLYLIVFVGHMSFSCSA